jgi:hypothetical protein
MPDRQTASCPKCQGLHLGRSQWHSRIEKQRNPGLRPLRCSDCGHRFLAPVPEDNQRTFLAAAAAAAAVVVVLAVVLTVGNGKAPEATAEAAPGISLSITPEAMKAAEAGDPEMQFAVANSMLSDAELSLAYSTKALDFLQQAAEHGHTRAMLRLGMLYRQGVGAPQNYQLAAKWIGEAARQGDPQAMLEFGRLYREGVGVARDTVKAYVWLNRAAAARDAIAPRERAEVARLLTTEELHRAQSESTAPPVPEAAPATPEAAPAPSPPGR